MPLNSLDSSINSLSDNSFFLRKYHMGQKARGDEIAVHNMNTNPSLCNSVEIMSEVVSMVINCLANSTTYRSLTSTQRGALLAGGRDEMTPLCRNQLRARK